MNVMPATRTRPLILNVDNDAGRRLDKTRLLTAGQFDVIEAAEGATALQLIVQRQPLLVLLDAGPADLDGLEICRRIKIGWPEIIVIRLSATAIAPADKAVDLVSDADCYLRTPIDPMELIAVTKAMLRLQRAEAAAQQARDLVDANAMLRSEIQGRKHAGGQFRQLQEMDALGQLTGGIAHDFNNLLAAILGGLEVTRRRVDDPRSRKLIDSAMSAARRGARMVAQLMAFARKQHLHAELLLLNPLLQEMQDVLQLRAGAAAQLNFHLAANVWPVMADAGQVRSALLNLVENARDAMPGGGTLHIATYNVCVDQTDDELAAGDYAALSVQDSGTGMPKGIQDRLFEPFFTTKGVGKGTGLGLAQVYGFVRQSSGNVRVHSQVGHGTTITILLPRDLAAGPAGMIA